MRNIKPVGEVLIIPGERGGFGDCLTTSFYAGGPPLKDGQRLYTELQQVVELPKKNSKIIDNAYCDFIEALPFPLGATHETCIKEALYSAIKLYHSEVIGIKHPGQRRGDE